MGILKKNKKKRITSGECLCFFLSFFFGVFFCLVCVCESRCGLSIIWFDRGEDDIDIGTNIELRFFQYHII